jgi:metallo-beta-lactamase family protein
MAAKLSIAFQGAARTVTGSRHFIRFGAHAWLFDCGLYQGHRDEAEAVNRTFAFEPASLESVVVSHAHLDHTGNLPTLSARGYQGEIHATPATRDLSRPMLLDSAFLQEKDVQTVNRRHPDRPRQPLYTSEDAAATLARFVVHEYGDPWELFPGVRVTYSDAGHILGSAITMFEMTSGGRTFRLCMSGDLGRPRRPILRDPEVPAMPVDALVLESTYGDRLHGDPLENEHQLAAVVTRTVERHGRVLVPAFSVGRTQELVATLHMLGGRGKVPDVPIFVDSPLAREATAVFVRHPELFDAETRQAFESHDGAPFGFDRLRYVSSADESRSLNDLDEPCIIIAGSGMCEGGRILHHLRHGIGDPRNTVLFVGFQAEGTLGRRIRDGNAVVNIFGEPYDVKAEVVPLDGFSAHADQRELLDWVGCLQPAPRRIFLVHGEPGPAETLAGLLRTRTGAEVHVPHRGEEFDLWK